MYNLIKFLVLAAQALAVLSSTDELKYPTDCGWTPMYPMALIVGGHTINPDEYSWMASLAYGNKDSSGVCGGSVINSWYVLTAAHCVTGPEVDNLGGLTGVRLGDFTQEPYCDYGTPNCTAYLHFGIAEKIVHEHYNNRSYINDIALLRVNIRIPLDNVLKPVCLPNANVNVSEPENGDMLTVSGWGNTMLKNESVAKRAVGVPLISDPNVCEARNGSNMCAGVLSSSPQTARTSCDGDSGGPLMQQCQKRKMMVEGIVSFIEGNICVNKYFPTYYTRVRHYLKWIDEHMCVGHDCQTHASIQEKKFPTDCGYVDAGNNRQSWLVKLKYKREGNNRCVGVIINSRYVLTPGWCENMRRIFGPLSGVELGDYDENGDICDHSTKNCTHYQQFGIEKIILHSGFRLHPPGRRYSIYNNIALIRLDRPIQFGPKMKPICLPFGGNLIPEPPLDSNLLYIDKNVTMNVTLHKRDMCNDYRYEYLVDEKQMCTVGNFTDFRPYCVLVHQFENQRVVLDGLYTYGHRRYFHEFLYKAVFTPVRNYGDWLDQNMEM